MFCLTEWYICSTFYLNQTAGRSSVQRSEVLDFLGGALLLQRVLTVLSAGFNALYFLGYLGQLAGQGKEAGNGLAWSRLQRRKVAVAVLACTNLALLVGGLLPLMAARFDLGNGRRGLELIAVLLPLAAALAMTALVLRAKSSR